jgi:hypothetical protein
VISRQKSIEDIRSTHKSGRKKSITSTSDPMSACEHGEIDWSRKLFWENQVISETNLNNVKAII